MFKLMHKINKFYINFNKLLLFLPLLSIFSSLSDKKIFKSINNIIKLLLVINIVLGVSVVLYFTDFVTPLNHTYSIYQDLLEPYIEVIKHLWNKLLTYFNNFINSEAVNTDSISQIKSEVKSGMKEAITEALNELEADADVSSGYLKQLALISSGVFFIYFIFILPGSGVEDLTQYNWFNQSLIEIKIHIINLFSKPSNPGNPPINNVIEINTNLTKTTIDTGTSPIVSNTSPVVHSPISDSTVSPNTPKPNISLFIKGTVDNSTQTNIDGLTVSKMVETVNILQDSLDIEVQDMITNHANKVINKITD